MLTNLGARVITLEIVTPDIPAAISGLAIASFSNSASEIFGETSMRSLILPLICRIAVRYLLQVVSDQRPANRQVQHLACVQEFPTSLPR